MDPTDPKIYTPVYPMGIQIQLKLTVFGMWVVNLTIPDQ